MKRVYDLGGKQTNSAVSCVLLISQGWGRIKLAAFGPCKIELSSQVTIVHQDSSQGLCVYTNVSDLARAGILTQVLISDASRPHEEQRHSPTSFLSGRFDKKQLD